MPLSEDLKPCTICGEPVLWGTRHSQCLTRWAIRLQEALQAEGVNLAPDLLHRIAMATAGAGGIAGQTFSPADAASMTQALTDEQIDAHFVAFCRRWGHNATAYLADNSNMRDDFRKTVHALLAAQPATTTDTGKCDTEQDCTQEPWCRIKGSCQKQPDTGMGHLALPPEKAASVVKADLIPAVGLLREGMTVITPDGREVEVWGFGESGTRCSDLKWYCASVLRVRAALSPTPAPKD